MKTFGNKTNQNLVSIGLDENNNPKLSELIPDGKWLEDDPHAPWNRLIDKDEEYIDNLTGETKIRTVRVLMMGKNEDHTYLVFIPPEIIPFTKESMPTFNSFTHRVIPRLDWENSQVVRRWDILAIPIEEQLTSLTIQFGKISQDRLDKVAQSWGYDSIVSLVSYAGDPNPRFDREGRAGVMMRSAEWTAADNYREVCLGQNMIPSLETYISSLPALPERPL